MVENTYLFNRFDFEILLLFISRNQLSFKANGNELRKLFAFIVNYNLSHSLIISEIVYNNIKSCYVHQM